MTRSEITQYSIDYFLNFIDEIKKTKGLSEYRIMKNCQKLQPDFKQRGLISQLRNGQTKYISLGMCLLIATANEVEFSIMKKSTMNYKEELERHTKMQDIAKRMEEELR